MSMDSSNFFWGGVGGFLVEFYSYLSVLKASKDKRTINIIETDVTDEENLQDPEPIEEWKEIFEVFRPLILLFCLFSAIAGGVMAYLINPRDPFLALFIGFTASVTLSKFAPKHII